MFEEREFGGLASPDDAVREYGLNAGRDNPSIAWIVTPWDVLVANPFYRGAPVPHPDDDFDGSNPPRVWAPVDTVVVAEDDLPF